MNLLRAFRALAARNRSTRAASGGRIHGGLRGDDSVPVKLSDGYALAHGHAVGADWDGPVLVQGRKCWGLDPAGRPDWMTEAMWARIGGKAR